MAGQFDRIVEELYNKVALGKGYCDEVLSEEGLEYFERLINWSSGIKESWHDGQSWYRIYNDGWCMQGGAFSSVAGANQVFTFLKPFKDTNYQMFATNFQTTDAGICTFAFTPYTKESCYYCTAYNGSFYSEYFYWFACGYVF